MIGRSSATAACSTPLDAQLWTSHFAQTSQDNRDSSQSKNAVKQSSQSRVCSTVPSRRRAFDIRTQAVNSCAAQTSMTQRSPGGIPINLPIEQNVDPA